MTLMMIILLIVGVLAILFALLQGSSIKRIPVTDKRIAEIGGHIADGAMAYLKRQYKILAIFVVILAIILALLGLIPSAAEVLGWKTAIAFVVGALFSGLAGFCGMKAATSANMRVTEKAKSGIAEAFRVAFTGGSVMGLIVVGLGGVGIAVVYGLTQNANILTGFSLGASSIALFCRVGGGIYTKAADMGADLVGKVEEGIPEDDPRNPAVIADNVGDNVGDVAGMGADLFESYVGCIVSALLLAATWVGISFSAVSYVFFIVAAGIFASMLGILIVRVMKAKNVQGTLNFGTYLAAGILIVATLIYSLCTGDAAAMNAFWAILVGIVAGLAIGKLTEVYTSGDYKPVKEIAKSSETGAATNIVSGLSYGMMSTIWPILLIAITVILANVFVGIIGIALAAVGMLATVGIVISVDAYGPVSDNAGGIAEMSYQEENVREITDHLDSVGNTTAAIGKGFSISSAALTALALFASYATTVGLQAIDILDPWVLAGVLIGAALPFVFGALTMSSVGRTANKMILEVRRQFREHKGILEGTEQPDYVKCVDISTGAAIREMVLPAVLAIVSPILVGVLGNILAGKGALAVAGLLVGSTVTGVLLAIKMSNAGGAWDNAKKFIEAAGRKGTPEHAAAVVGDTVGDPLKDTSGPSMNILIKLMSVVAVVFAPLFLL